MPYIEHLDFTGGEPLMKHAQQASVDGMQYYNDKGQRVPSVTYETNGTQPLTEQFISFWKDDPYTELFFSISPKLWTVAGEKRDRAIKPIVVSEYADLCPETGQLKFVCNGTTEAWEEIEELVDMYRSVGVEYPIWIMPIGGTIEGQKGEIDGHIPAHVIADEALARGYRVAARVHAYLWENIIGK